MADGALLPHLPDLIMHQIILQLPTKPAIRMSSLSKQWEGIWSALPVLDFDEGNQRHDDENNFYLKHSNFINILARYLEFRKKDKQQPLLDKLRLRMTYLYGDEEDAIIGMLLRNSFERNVQDFDFSLGSERQEAEGYYCLPLPSLVNAKCVTNLNLEYLWIKDIECAATEPMLPSLKTLSLRNVRFLNEAFFNLISGCPSAEYLSLASCSFDSPEFHVSSSSLKSVEVKNCDVVHVRVAQAINLESFTFVSNCPLLLDMVLRDSMNLSYIKIRAQQLKICGLFGCHDNLKATINTPNLVHIDFKGDIKSKLSLSAPNLQIASIRLGDQYFSSFNGPWNHFATLRDFLQAFDCSKGVMVSTQDYKDIVFPENFKRAFYPPLPNVKSFGLVVSNNPRDETDETCDLEDSLHWAAPSASDILICK